MALTDTQKVDILWKSLQKRAASSTLKAFYEEANYSVASIMASQIWSQADQITTPAVAVTSGVISYHASVLMTEDVTVSGQKSYTTVLKDWIHPSIDTTYQVRVYQNNAGSPGAEVPPTDTSVWVFDYNSGTLTFFGTNTSHTKPYFIKGWRYVGNKGIATSVATLSETFVSGDWDPEVVGVSDSLSFAHGLGSSSLQVSVFEDKGSGLFVPANVDWVISNSTLKLLIASGSAFSGKVEARVI